MSNEIVKFSNQFNNVALKKFDAVHLDVLMAIASRVREKGTATVEFSFEELRGLMRLRENLTNRQLADKIVQTNARLLALNYMFEDSGKIIQFALFTKFVTDPQEASDKVDEAVGGGHFTTWIREHHDRATFDQALKAKVHEWFGV